MTDQEIIHILETRPPDPKRRGDCTDPPLGYLEWHADAERRHKAGQRQTWCERCQKWQWRLCKKECPQ
jgi:hypothetical protein